MGEAKRRKQLDPNYGKPNFEIKLDVDFIPSPELQKVCGKLDENQAYYEKAIIVFKGESYPAVFMPFVRKYKGQPKLYAQFATTPPKLLRLDQAQIDKITQKYCLDLLKRGKLPGVIEKQFHRT